MQEVYYLELNIVTAQSSAGGMATCSFAMNAFDKDKELVAAGGWLAYADRKY